ncbi:MAG: hypothetical protein KDA57_19425 [Planctomycetales bacterium]|nr:hypothetical protein [Planctomycetales bacterium]
MPRKKSVKKSAKEFVKQAGELEAFVSAPAQGLTDQHILNRPGFEGGGLV